MFPRHLKDNHTHVCNTPIQVVGRILVPPLIFLHGVTGCNPQRHTKTQLLGPLSNHFALEGKTLIMCCFHHTLRNRPLFLTVHEDRRPVLYNELGFERRMVQRMGALVMASFAQHRLDGRIPL